MIAEANLVGWMCMVHNQWTHDIPCFIPEEIGKALMSKGWIAVEPKDDWDGKRPTKVLPAGALVIDLNGPDWGIQTIPEEEGA